MSAATIHNVKKSRGVAGQIKYTALVSYPDDGDDRQYVVAFVGDVYGAPGPVVMCTESNPKGVFVTDAGRFGAKFDETWVRHFFGTEH